jgi:hypothetical protein
LCNNLVSDSIFLVFCTLLHNLHSKQRQHFIPKTENSVHCQAGAPCPQKQFKRRNTNLGRNNNINNFMWFTLQPKPATATHRVLVDWIFKTKTKN